ncbi:response regulator transcription factor [Planomonospora sp. ID82291]|uniref:response regulator transcription factor n=1 Tax=Planomonospora sp. ID82291 TaxID=2738136 RepID=UPI0018C44AD6|nr:response regulator [Planomonospora sp. ID82291]MBG0818794.1 response regulator [Planomonospora sp. ID82291]
MARVLTVEDDADIQFVISFALKKAGHEVKMAGDGLAAMDALAEKLPDVVILDWMMPGLSGPEVCRRLREMPGGQNVAVLMLSAKSEQDDVTQAFEAGVDDYMTKPFSPKDLATRVQDLLARVAGTHL